MKLNKKKKIEVTEAIRKMNYCKAPSGKKEDVVLKGVYDDNGNPVEIDPAQYNKLVEIAYGERKPGK